MIELIDVSLQKGDKFILKNIHLQIHPREIHSILGMNGTGKSTLAYVIMGLHGYQLDRGKILLDGKDIKKLHMAERAKLGLTLAWQEPARFEGLTVREYLGLSKKESKNNLSIEECLRRVGLEPKNYLDREVDTTLSGGERKRIELASVLAMQPRLAILDEPDSGIDSLSIDYIKDVIRTLVADGSSVLLITHQEEVAAMADRTTALCAGQVLRSGSPEEVTRFFRNHCRPCPHVNQPDQEVVING